MRIRPAEESDLPQLAEIFVRDVTYLDDHFTSGRVVRPSLDPGSRLPIYRHLLRTGAVFVAEEDRPVGFSAAVLREGVWFLSQLWVVPERHGSGIGSVLLDEALAWGREASAFTVVSSPHPAAQLLYLRASMYPLWAQVEVTGARPPVPAAPEGTWPIDEGDQPWIDELDRETRGVARPQDHVFWRTEADGVAVRRDGEELGYVYVWPDGRVGPGAVRHPTYTPTILAAARARAAGPVTLAVPSTNWAALRELVRLGFGPLRSNLFMASRPLPDGSRYLSSGGALA